MRTRLLAIASLLVAACGGESHAGRGGVEAPTSAAGKGEDTMPSAGQGGSGGSGSGAAGTAGTGGSNAAGMSAGGAGGTNGAGAGAGGTRSDAGEAGRFGSGGVTTAGGGDGTAANAGAGGRSDLGGAGGMSGATAAGGKSGASGSGGTGGAKVYPGTKPGFSCFDAGQCALGQACSRCQTSTSDLSACVPDPDYDRAGYDAATADCASPIDYGTCDGPEDCSPGEYCVFGGDSFPRRFSCSSGPASPPIDCQIYSLPTRPSCTLCYTDDDCPSGQHCWTEIVYGSAGGCLDNTN